MHVISDSSPLHYLALVDALSVLPKLFERIHIPRAVHQELLHPVAPPEVRKIMLNPPDWLKVEAVEKDSAVGAIESLGLGEKEAISLALDQLPDALLIIDEEKGRKVAAKLQVRHIGTLGVLGMAASRELIDLPSAISRLLETNFYVAPSLLKTLLEADLSRRAQND